jgi:hypothetical protein
MFTQLSPPIPLWTLSHGAGLAHGVIDYGPDFDLLWVVFMQSGEIWTLGNSDVRGVENATLGRRSTAEALPPE